MNKLSALLIASIMMMSVNSFAQEGSHHEQDWSYSIGVGAVYSPNYLGDDEGQASVIPNVHIEYKDKFFASLGEGIGYNVISNKNWKVGPIVKYDSGRDEEGSNLLGTGDDTNDLIGLGDVDGSVEVGAYLEYTLGPITTKLEVRQGLGGHEGLVGEASIHYGGEANIYGQQLVYSIGPEIKYTDGNYNKAFFGVNATQSAASGLRQYDADDATVSYGIGGNLVIPHTQHVSTIIFADYTKLGNTIADSSLVTQRGSEDQAMFGIFLNYSF